MRGRPDDRVHDRVLAGFHPVREALRAHQPLRYLIVSRERRDARIEELLQLAKSAGVPVRFEAAPALERMSGGNRHQGVIAFGAARQAVSLDDLLATPPTPGKSLLIALDSIEDPHNVGAIARSACAAGATGILLPDRRSAGLTAAVDRVAAGALEFVPVARVVNLVRALEQTKTAGYWSVGLDERADKTVWDIDFWPPTTLVIGAEARGLHDLLRRSCDFLASIPMATGVASLNASAAAAIALFEAVRQRREHRSPTSLGPG